jgi:hypothetical protein
MTDASILIDRALAELKLTRYGWPKNGKPTGHMKNVVDLLEQAKGDIAPKPNHLILGPVIPGGLPILEQDLTHITDGMTEGGSVWPAFDDGVGHPGMAVLAPEMLTITGHGHAKRRDGSPNGLSINVAVGASKIRYWIGHVEMPAAVGTVVKAGGKIAVISANHEAPHVHFGIDAIPLIGHDFAHHTNYTHGAPTVGAQLRAAGH